MTSGQVPMWYSRCQGANLVKVGQKKHPMEGELLVPRSCGGHRIGTSKEWKEDNVADESVHKDRDTTLSGRQTSTQRPLMASIRN